MPPIAHATVTTLAAFPATTVVPYSPVPDLYLQCWRSAWAPLRISRIGPPLTVSGAMRGTSGQRAQHGCTTTGTM